jgi:hypothetical protein
MAAALAPGSGALNPETAILTDPHGLLTRNRGNVLYLKKSAAHVAMQHSAPTPVT